MGAAVGSLRTLLVHCQAICPYYRDRLIGRFEANDLLILLHWEALPILTRRALHENFDALKPEAPSASYITRSVMSSSGYTDTPV